MKLFQFCLLGLFCILLIAAKAQVPGTGTIKGNLVDEQKKPVAFATIVLKNMADSSLYKTALSNEKGDFFLNGIKYGDYLIEVTIMGFEKTNKAKVNIGDNHPTIDLGTMILKTASNLLASVTIKGETPSVERKIDKTVVNVDQRITNAGSTVLELMKKLPGVQVTSDGQITMNGKSGINVYIDGKPTYLSDQDLSSLLASMPSSNIQQLELMTNPSAKYDAAGTTGIINIVKKKNHKEGFNGSVNGSIGQGYYGRYNGGITLSYKNEAYNFYFNNSYTYNKTLFGRTVTNNIFDSNNALLTQQLSYNNDVTINRSYAPTLGLDLYLSKKTTLSLTGNAAIRVSDDKTISTMDVFDQNLMKTNTENFTAINNDKPTNYTIGLSVRHQLDTAGKEVSIDADYSDYRNMPGQYNSTILNDAMGNFQSLSDVFLDENRQLNIYAIKADYTQPLTNKGRLEAGIKSSYVKVDNNNTYYNQVNGQNLVDSSQSDYSVNTENINAAYINLNKTYKKLDFETGLRAEQTVAKGQQIVTGQSIDQNYFQLFPSMFFDYKLTEQDGLNFKFGRRVERPAYHEMVPFRRALTPTLYFEGNPNLKPQLTWHTEATYSWHGELFVTFGYDIDRDFVRTLPFLDSNKVTVTRIPINIQHSGSWNVDITFSKKLNKWWSTDNTLSTYQNHFDGQVNGYNLNNGGIVAIYFTANNTFHLNDNLSTECDFEYDSKRQLIYSTYGAYSILSFGVKQQLFGDKGSISLNANNVLQSEDDTSVDKYEGLNQYSSLHYYTRSVRLNFTYRFGSGKTAKTASKSSSEDEQKRAGG